MNKLGYSLSELVSSLQAMEEIVTGGHGVLNLEKASSSRPRPKGRGRRNKKDSNQIGAPNPTVGKKAKKGKKKANGKQKRKYFHCGVPGH